MAWLGVLLTGLGRLGWSPSQGWASAGMARTAGPPSAHPSGGWWRLVQIEAAFQESENRGCKTYWGRGLELMVTSLHSTDQSKTQVQTRLTRWVNRFCLLIRGVVKNLGPFAIELMVWGFCSLLWSPTVCVQILALLSISCDVLGKLTNLSLPISSSLKWK